MEKPNLKAQWENSVRFLMPSLEKKKKKRQGESGEGTVDRERIRDWL